MRQKERRAMPDFRRATTHSRRLSSALLLLLLTRLSQLSSCALTELEKEYVAVPLASGARESLKFITSKPHVAGTPGDHEVNRAVGICAYRGWFLPERTENRSDGPTTSIEGSGGQIALKTILPHQQHSLLALAPSLCLCCPCWFSFSRKLQPTPHAQLSSRSVSSSLGTCGGSRGNAFCV